MENEKTCGPDYKAEYHKLMDLYNKLCTKHEELRIEYDNLETQFAVQRAQLDIVYLIFGGK